MTNDALKKLSPLDRFVWFIKERHQVYLRRKAGLPRPWTDNPILQTYAFCNVYRELDKTSKWFRENFRDPYRDDPRVLLGTITFRWFNRIRTGELLRDNDLLLNWDSKRAIALLSACDFPVFTAAFVVNAPTGMSKVAGVCQAIDWIRDFRVPQNQGVTSLRRTTEALASRRHMGPFMAYQVVADLRHTHYLENAPDINTWCSPGFGTLRGLSWLRGIPPEAKHDHRTGKKGWTNSKPKLKPGDIKYICDLIPVIKERTRLTLEAQDVTNCLCETDKFNRILYGLGTAKKYTPGR
jgi:hypothetical protein